MNTTFELEVSPRPPGNQMFLEGICSDERQQPYKFDIPLSSGAQMMVHALTLLCRRGYGYMVKAEPDFSELVKELRKLESSP